MEPTLHASFPLYFGQDLLGELAKYGKRAQVAKGESLLREGEYVAAIPLVLEGCIKVGRKDGLHELLLYYIQPGERCILSFRSAIQQTPSRAAALAEQDSEVLLLPAERLGSWQQQYPELQRYFLELYQLRYESLISAIHLLAFEHLDQRIMAYLRQQAAHTGAQSLNLTHLDMAHDIGAAREAVSRVLKKLEKAGVLELGRGLIRLH